MEILLLIQLTGFCRHKLKAAFVRRLFTKTEDIVLVFKTNTKNAKVTTFKGEIIRRGRGID